LQVSETVAAICGEEPIYQWFCALYGMRDRARESGIGSKGGQEIIFD